MKIFAVLVIGVTLVLSANGGPTPAQPLPPTPPISDIDPFEHESAPACTTDELIGVFNGMIDTRYRWTNFNVYPVPAYNAQERQAINDAMYNLQQIIPCVRFGIWPPEASPTGDYVRINKGTNNGCSSYVGRIGGRQEMNLQSPGCMSIGTIMHEMIHALGFHHEQCSPLREVLKIVKYNLLNVVNIHWENMQAGTEHNFDKYPTSMVSTFGVPYNLRSIMHYESGAFSRNGQPTMTAKNGQPIGSTGQLQETDIRKLKAMYGC